MRLKITILLSFIFSTALLKAQDSLTLRNSLKIREIYDEALVNGQCYGNLHYLCKNIGPRLSGSANAQKAVEWSKKLMENYGFDHVFLQEVMVPHWVRGVKEVGMIIDGNTKITVPITALGMSVATPKEGITANVIEVHSLKELDDLGKSTINGKIVFFNRPFDPRFIETLRAYGIANDQRNFGPAAAAKYGAIGVIVRSLTETLDDYPHTGATRYDPNVIKIPAAAISTKAADQLSNLLKQRKISFYFKQNCQTLPDTVSYNVVGELKGSENPNKYITVGGHLDSWDLAEGAHDDGTGVMQSVEALRVLKTLGYRPKNTIRVAFFMNEENGDKGGIKYAELAAQNKETHLAAIESDLGGFTPRGFSFSGISPEIIKNINVHWRALLDPYGSGLLIAGDGGGTDIDPLKDKTPGVVLIGYLPDPQRYFDVHHTSNDVFENVNKRELELGAASIAALIYLIDQHGFN